MYKHTVPSVILNTKQSKNLPLSWISLCHPISPGLSSAKCARSLCFWFPLPHPPSLLNTPDCIERLLIQAIIDYHFYKHSDILWVFIWLKLSGMLVQLITFCFLKHCPKTWPLIMDTLLLTADQSGCFLFLLRLPCWFLFLIFTHDVEFSRAGIAPR